MSGHRARVVSSDKRPSVLCSQRYGGSKSSTCLFPETKEVPKLSFRMVPSVTSLTSSLFMRCLITRGNIYKDRFNYYFNDY